MLKDIIYIKIKENDHYEIDVDKIDIGRNQD